jgi:probable rRNA maturation factor
MNNIEVYIDDSLQGREEEFEGFLDSIAEIASKAVDEEGIGNCEASIVLGSDDFIHELNRDYRNNDSVTDVLSFPLNDLDKPLREKMDNKEPVELERGEEADIALGDIYIAVERTRIQAEEYGNTFLEELRFLTVHGMLHLMGYDHIKENDEIKMRMKQRAILGRVEKKNGSQD